MNVLKFGGTSVGSAENIKKVIEIVKSASENDHVVVVVSAVGGITDKLMRASQKAIENDLNYKSDFDKLKQQHVDIMEGLLSGSTFTDTKDVILEKLSELERLLDGIFLINELSPKTTDKLLSFGELMSSLIIFEAMQEQGRGRGESELKDLMLIPAEFSMKN